MLSLSLSLSQTTELRQTLELHSVWLGSCLIKSEKIVYEHQKEILKAFKWEDRISKKPVRHYRSTMDMILCNVYPYYKRGCLYYYQGRGVQLNKLYSDPQIKFIDNELATYLLKLIE